MSNEQLRDSLSHGSIALRAIQNSKFKKMAMTGFQALLMS